MRNEVYRFEVKEERDVEDADVALELAVFSVENLYGPVRAKLELDYCFDRQSRTIVVEAQNACGRALAQLLVGHLTNMVGQDYFRIEKRAGSTPATPIR